MVRRRFKVALVVASAVGLAYAALPALFAQRIRAELAERGFPDARLDVESVGWDHLKLRDVHLADGIDLGTLELDGGISLLWREPEEVAIERAHVSTKALARAAPTVKRKSGGPPPFARATVRDSIVEVDGKQTRVAGKAAAKGTRLDIAVSVREPTAKGWSAEGRGRIVWTDRVELEKGEVAIEVPRQAVGGATVHRARVEAEVRGDLTSLQLKGSGTARFARIGLRDADVSSVTMPFTFDRSGVSIGQVHGFTAGGELTLDPFVWSGAPVRLTVRAKGLRLGELLEPTERATGTGVLDGYLSVQLSRDVLELERGELRARHPGRIRVARGSAGEAEPFDLQKKVVDALTDFEFETLKAELAPRGAASELTLQTRGRGRLNKQELDIAVRLNGVRDVAKRLTGGN